MKVYLIKPKFPVTYWGFEFANDLSGLKYTTPPLGLATVAALTPPDVDVEICDENIEEIDFEKDCDIVGLTAYLVQGPRAYQIAEKFRKRGKTVVMGGPITSLDVENCTASVDVTFIGEAEHTWKQFIEDYRNDSYNAQYVQAEKIDMRDSPVPRFDLLKLEQYGHAAIQTTRGCPFNCEFCDIIVLFGRHVRCKPVEQVIKELREAVKQPADSIFITDDNFIGNKKYAKNLLRGIIEFNKTLDRTVQYMTQLSINLAKDEELLQLFYEAGFTKVFIGIESPRKESLQETNKSQNFRTDLVADVKKIQSYNICVSAGMIVGFDHDDVHIFQEQFDFLMETNIIWAMAGILQAVPKTPLYERLKKENRLDTSTSEDFEGNNTALNINIIPKNMTKEELANGYTWLIRKLYSYENYGKRVIGNLKEYTKKPTVKFYFPTLPQLKTVLRTLRYYLLTWDRKRRKFSWDILKYVVLHRPFAFHDAMVQMVSFKHLHAYVYEHLENTVGQKANVLKEWEHTLSQKAAALISNRAAATYEELRKQAAVASAKAVTAYEELCKQAAAKSQQALTKYEELAQQAVAASKQAAAMCEELGKHSAAVSQQTTLMYEELEKHASVASQQVAAKYEELRKQTALVSRQIAAKYEELSQQAAALSQQVAAVSKQAAAVYKEIADQARTASKKAALLCEELEEAIKILPASHLHQEG